MLFGDNMPCVGIFLPTGISETAVVSANLFNVALGDASGGPLGSCAPGYGSVRRSVLVIIRRVPDLLQSVFLLQTMQGFRKREEYRG